MVKRMLIDATHPEETRVVVVNGTRIEELDVETSTKKQLKGNVYLAKIVRVEPSLQAAFVDYGGSRHGFLAFSEIHPDYYQIPAADRRKLLEAVSEDEDPEQDETARDVDENEEPDTRPLYRLMREYKIQEVIKRRQILLVQVVKEERGNKGAALTTYLSLAGRYCVLMPNATRGGGVSRKITSLADRKRLKALLTEFNLPPGMAVILRTAGAERVKSEIRRDYEYLARSWNQTRDTTLRSYAPALVYEEASLIKRAIRDLYSRDIDEIIVAGEESYRLAKDFMKMLTPSHAKKVQRYKEEELPLLHRYRVAAQIDAMHSPEVQLRSGGYIVINQTEALVAIDVNSGKATRERHIEETALKTNLEAAEEIARQLRLRDLAGLIVIDFIDMEENRNNVTVEKRLKEALKSDRARVQVGRISPFGLLELSRQRLRPSLMETNFLPCPHCNGTGLVRSVESSAMHVLRAIEEEGLRHRSLEINVICPMAVALYLLNHKRQALAGIEVRYGFHVLVSVDTDMVPPAYRLERLKTGREEGESDSPADDLSGNPLPPAEDDTQAIADDTALADETASKAEDGDADGGENNRPRRRRRRRGRREDTPDNDPEGDEDAAAEEEGGTTAASPEIDDDGGDDAPALPGSEERRRRRRGRRGGRRRRRSPSETEEMPVPSDAEPRAEGEAAGEKVGRAPQEASQDVLQEEDIPAASFLTQSDENETEKDHAMETSPRRIGWWTR
ncbi:MAG: ribonuclease E [Rhodospirillaceae bacterium]|nr:MAG: ribonuclease E [Rhodospirillaceae bacterium]